MPAPEWITHNDLAQSEVVLISALRLYSLRLAQVTDPDVQIASMSHVRATVQNDQRLLDMMAEIYSPPGWIYGSDSDRAYSNQAR